MQLRTRSVSLSLAEEFGIARGSRTTQAVVQVELEHDGLIGRGEAAPVYYRGESVETATAFLADAGPGLGDDPFALEEILGRLEGDAAARAALDAAFHDWIGQAARGTRVAPARPVPERPAHLLHDRHRHARGHPQARPWARRATGR